MFEVSIVGFFPHHFFFQPGWKKIYNDVLFSTWIKIYIQAAYTERLKPVQYEEISV